MFRGQIQSGKFGLPQARRRLPMAGALVEAGELVNGQALFGISLSLSLSH
jgi:hypothetical protein